MDDKEILQVFKSAEDPFLFTGEVAAKIGFSNPGTTKRLKRLAKNDMLYVKRAGKVPAWWITDKGRAYLSGDLDASDIDD